MEDSLLWNMAYKENGKGNTKIMKVFIQFCNQPNFHTKSYSMNISCGVAVTVRSHPKKYQVTF